MLNRLLDGVTQTFVKVFDSADVTQGKEIRVQLSSSFVSGLMQRSDGLNESYVVALNIDGKDAAAQKISQFVEGFFGRVHYPDGTEYVKYTWRCDLVPVGDNNRVLKTQEDECSFFLPG